MKDAIFEMYRQLSLGKNDICRECNPNDKLEIPLAIYYVGDEFHSSNDTIFFVGKTAVGGEGIGVEVDGLFTDTKGFGEESLDLTERRSKQRKIYTYTHEIIKRYYGSYELGKKFIALSNSVKCNDGSTVDNTTDEIRENCMDKLKVIWKELEILNPKRIIFYTGRKYDDFIDRFNPSGCFKSEHIEDNEIDCWWHKRFYKQDMTVLCDILRVYHPDVFRFIGDEDGEEYINKIVNWLQQTKIYN
jgi:hypothetical protein